jgi:hypothetical protein
MLLRRVLLRFRNQEWTAIGIELSIVVAGVFIGIQAANWNEARVERELVRGHLSEIAQDLQRHLDFAEELERSARLRIAAVDYIYHEAFRTRLPTRLILAKVPWDAPVAEPFPADQLDNLMGAVNLVRVSVRSRNGYESLISSGRLALLRNRELARKIQTYYGNYDDLLDTQTNVFRAFRNEGARDQYAIGLSVFDQRPPAEIVALARDNPAFAAYLRGQREWAILHYNLLRNVDTETKALLAAIGTELANH